MLKKIKNTLYWRFKTMIDGYIKKRDIALLFNSYLGALSVNSLVVIGCNSGQEVPFYLRYFSRIDLVDPFISSLDMHKACSHNSVNLLNSAVSDTSGEREIYEADNNKESSSLLRPTHHMSEYPEVLFQVKKVSCIRLNDLDFFKYASVLILDVQGSELDVLKSAFPIGVEHLSIIICEYSLVPLYENSSDLSDLLTFFDKYNFSLMFTISPYISKNECTGDAVFLNNKLISQG